MYLSIYLFERQSARGREKRGWKVGERKWERGRMRARTPTTPGSISNDHSGQVLEAEDKEFSLHLPPEGQYLTAAVITAASHSPC